MAKAVPRPRARRSVREGDGPVTTYRRGGRSRPALPSGDFCRTVLFSISISPNLQDADHNPATAKTSVPLTLNSFSLQADNYDDNPLAWFTQFKNATTTSPLYQRGMARVTSVPAVSRVSVVLA